MNPSIDTLNDMVNTPATCDLGYDGCEVTAYTFDTHPTGDALGEDGWESVWFCSPCAVQAALDS